MNFTSVYGSIIRYELKLRVGRSWSKVKTVKTPVIVAIFPFYEQFTLKYYSALDLMYI